MDPIKETIERMHQDPGLPSGNPTTAFWQEPAHPILKDIQSPVLPTSVDVVIIGSGITGCSVANTLLSGSENLKVVMLEARTATSGATGRNGGHIKEMPFYEYSELVEQHGKEAAQQLIRFRLSHLDALMSFAEQLGQDVVRKSEIRIVETVDAVFDEVQWQHIKTLLRNFLDDFPEEAGKWHAYERVEVIARYGIPTAVGVITGPAGALWPYRLITQALEGLLSSHKQRFSLETHTPVLSISTEDSESSLQHRVITNRGTIRARHVVHCTNGYVGHLLPKLRGTVFPIRGQMTVQNPGQSFPSNNGARRSWSFVYKRGFDYMTQSAVSNDIYLGGGFAHGENKGLDDLGVSSDEQLSLLALAHLNGLLPTVYGTENWGLDAAHQPRVKAAWTGIMGFSSDGRPWVGKLPDELTGRHPRPGGAEWIAAAFCGEGMVHCWQSGRALGEMILGNEIAIAEWFPKLLYPTVERLQRARVEDFITRTI